MAILNYRQTDGQTKIIFFFFAFELLMTLENKRLQFLFGFWYSDFWQNFNCIQPFFKLVKTSCILHFIIEETEAFRFVWNFYPATSPNSENVEKFQKRNVAKKNAHIYKGYLKSINTIRKASVYSFRKLVDIELCNCLINT